MTIIRNFKRFQYLKFETNFLKNTNPFQKTGVPSFNTIENALFPDKTALLEANVKKNRIESIKWIYHKERSFASN